MDIVMKAENISKIYRRGAQPLRALDNVSLEIKQGEFAAVVGASGSGKSTLMNILGCLDVPDSGAYYLLGEDVSRCSPTTLSRIRSEKIGFVFQSFHLIGALSALENVELPLLYAGVPAAERHRRAKAALETVGLSARMHHKPRELSGGQQQRVAIARAIVTEPAILLADEPTGNLDSAMGAQIMALLRSLHDAGKTVLLITHDPSVAAAAGRQITVADGKIVPTVQH